MHVIEGSKVTSAFGFVTIYAREGEVLSNRPHFGEWFQTKREALGYVYSIGFKPRYGGRLPSVLHDSFYTVVHIVPANKANDYIRRL